MTDYVLYQIRIDATILCRIRPELFDVFTLLGNDVRRGRAGFKQAQSSPTRREKADEVRNGDQQPKLPARPCGSGIIVNECVIFVSVALFLTVVKLRTLKSRKRLQHPK
jgi:hypothetical protein